MKTWAWSHSGRAPIKDADRDRAPAGLLMPAAGDRDTCKTNQQQVRLRTEKYECTILSGRNHCQNSVQESAAGIPKNQYDESPPARAQGLSASYRIRRRCWICSRLRTSDRQLRMRWSFRRGSSNHRRKDPCSLFFGTAIQAGIHFEHLAAGTGMKDPIRSSRLQRYRRPLPLVQCVADRIDVYIHDIAQFTLSEIP